MDVESCDVCDWILDLQRGLRVQDRYAGDVGDLSKFVLLQALAHNDLRTGVVWYLNLRHEENGDGKFTDLSRVSHLCPDIAKQLLAVSSSSRRSVAALEQCGVAPADTVFFSEALPQNSAERNEWSLVRAARANWLERAVSSIRCCDLVFLDPDNGLAPSHYSKSRKLSAKYAFTDELERFTSEGRSVVLYQHLPRVSLESCFELTKRRVSSFCKNVWAVSFHLLSVRLYFVLASDRDREKLWNRTHTLANGPWGRNRWFRQHSDGSC
jgi:hypothetical protein